jgi:hypothetical protein
MASSESRLNWRMLGKPEARKLTALLRLRLPATDAHFLLCCHDVLSGLLLRTAKSIDSSQLVPSLIAGSKQVPMRQVAQQP